MRGGLVLLGGCLVAVAGITMANRVRSAERFVGLVTLVAAGCVAALALGTGLEALLGPQGPGSFAYFFATALAPLVACAAGLLALRWGGLCRFAARALAATPVLTILSAVILLQFPVPG